MEPTDATLARYLLGDLPPEQADALDERSVVDAAFADRLRVAEQDLADAAARGELSAEDRQRWDRTLGASAGGRDELQLARALAAYEQRRASVNTAATPAATRWTARTLIGLAAAATVILALAVGYRMRTPPPTTAVAANPASTMTPATTPAPAPASVPAPAAAAPSFVALTLFPPTRSAADPPVLTIPPGTSEARFTLQLEPNQYDRFAVALRDLQSRRTIWQEADLPARLVDGRRVLPLTISVSTLHAGRFAFELRGIAGKHSEPIDSYPLTIQINAQ